ncbi:hypothetical protein ACP4OV_001455 [Aristida adscensionis]
MAAASAGPLAADEGARAQEHDDVTRLRPRLLRELLDGRLPLPDDGGDDDDRAPRPRPRRSPADLAYAADALRARGLLAEEWRAADDGPELAEEWRAAVDAWVDRLLKLMDSGKEHSCWVGTSFLGLTIQECCDRRFEKSYPDWFEKLLKKIKAPSGIKMLNIFTCTTIYDLFVRLATFPNLKDKASSLAQKVVKPSLRLLDENGPVADKAADLLGLLMKLFPSSVYRHFNDVESTITARIMSGQCNTQISKKLASTLALLPRVRASKKRISLMIRKILIVVNKMLNDTFFRLEEAGRTDHETMALLAPPGGELIPPLRGQTITYGDGHIHLAKNFCSYVVPTISALTHCCSLMLTIPFPIKVVNIPVRALLKLIQKVLLFDGSFHDSLLQEDTSFQQELICSGIPTLHLTFLDLLSSTIKGMCSSLIPHAGIVVMIIEEYFKRAKLPAIRRKIYTIVQLLLSSMGFGMAVQLLQVVITNIFVDLDDSTAGSSSNPTSNSQMMAPLCVKIAALETLEVLLNMGGTVRACNLTAEMDLLLIDVATNAFYKAELYEKSSLWIKDSSISDLQLASLKALLASFLSNPDESRPYLGQGIELFKRGKVGEATELANFCSHALLALDAVIYPQPLPQEYIPKNKSVAPSSARKRKLKSRPASSAKKPKNDLAKGNAADEHAPFELPGNLSVQDDAQEQLAITGQQHSETTAPCLPYEVQDAPAPSRTDIEMAEGLCGNLADPHLLGNPLDSSDPPAPTNIAQPDSHNPGIEASNEMSGHQEGILLGDASNSQNVPAHNSPVLVEANDYSYEWDSLEPLLDMGNFNFIPDLVPLDLDDPGVNPNAGLSSVIGNDDIDLNPDAGWSLSITDYDIDLGFSLAIDSNIEHIPDAGFSFDIGDSGIDLNPDAGLTSVIGNPDPDHNPDTGLN